MRMLRSVDSVRAAVTAALGFTALSCGARDLGSPEEGVDAGPTADSGVPSPDTTSSSESMFLSEATSPYDAKFPSDATLPSDATSPEEGAATDVAGPGDATGEGAADREGSDVVMADCTRLLVGGQDTGYVTCSGQLQRRAMVDCPNLLTQSSLPCTYSDAAPCQANQDCTAMPYGACLPGRLGAGGCFCNYGCVRDSDCTAGSICVCGDPIGECVAASCNAGTCGELACAEYRSGSCAFAFACQSPTDQCESNTDCDSGFCLLGDGGSQCGPPFSCGIGTGRPFLVAGEPRLPAIASADAWHAATMTPDVRAMPPALRAELARHWTGTARMEHASIAAFARFALQLLALGAPPDLVLDAQRAMGEETAHAQLAFTLASAFCGRDLGPGLLAIDAALDEASLQDFITTTFAEGCIGETAAAVEATEAAAGARDRAVRKALERIGEDETRHAQLAWRAVEWALHLAGRSARDVLGRCVAQAEAEARDLASEAPRPNNEHLAAYGILGEAHKRRLRREVLVGIVLPSARTLLEASPEAASTSDV